MLKIKFPITAAITIVLLVVLALATLTNSKALTAATSDLDSAATQNSTEEGGDIVESEEAGSSAQITRGENLEKAQEQISLDRSSIAQNVQDLVAKFAEEKIQPGWLHFVYETRNLSDRPSGPLDNGVSIPSDYLMEEWFHLGEEGTAIEIEGRLAKSGAARLRSAPLFQNDTGVGF